MVLHVFGEYGGMEAVVKQDLQAHRGLSSVNSDKLNINITQTN